MDVLKEKEDKTGREKKKKLNIYDVELVRWLSGFDDIQNIQVVDFEVRIVTF